MSNAPNNSDVRSNINALYKLDEEVLRPTFAELRDARRKAESLLIEVKARREILERILREERERLEAEAIKSEQAAEERIGTEDVKDAQVAPVEPEKQQAAAEQAEVATPEADVAAKTTEDAPLPRETQPSSDDNAETPPIKAEKSSKKAEKPSSKTEKSSSKTEKLPKSSEKSEADEPKPNPFRAQNVAEPRKFVPIRTYIPENNERHRRDGGAPRPAGRDFGSRPLRDGSRPAMPAAGTTYIPQPSPSGYRGSRSRKGGFDRGGSDERRPNKRIILRRELESGVEIDESEIARRFKSKKYQKASTAPMPVVIEKAVINTNPVPIKVLADKIGKPSADIVKKLLILGIFKNINDSIDFDTAYLISSEFKVLLELKLEQTMEEKFTEIFSEEAEDLSKLVKRAPIVTIMGHVDHGKTSLLDYIRKANVASGEAGGITQHIGAYTIKLRGEKITFLDTPGHEAFTALRARGAQVTDIAVIVVAADDSIMPQSIEAINHAKAAGVPIIIAINKIDKSGADIERVKVDMTQNGLLIEEWGGEVIAVPVSAKTGEGVDKLLENVLLIAELNELKANPKTTAKGTIIEARLDKAKGPVATVLVQNGTLKVSDYIVAGSVTGKVKSMFDDKGNSVKSASPSTPVAVLGFDEVPHAGDQIAVADEKLTKQIASERRIRERDDKLSSSSTSLEDIFKQIGQGKLKDLNLIVKGDVQGSVEALVQELNKLSNEEVKVNIVHSAVGAISESDVTLASTSNAIIIGFSVRPDSPAKAAAARFGIDIRAYRIIYDVVNDIELALKGMLTPKFKETMLGKAEVRNTFRITGIGTVAGCYVTDGKIERNAEVRLLRDNVVITESKISTLKRFKDDVKEVAQGYECGVGLAGYNDIKNGDVIECFINEKVE